MIKENFWEKLGLCAEQDLTGHSQNRHLHNVFCLPLNFVGKV